ncbi:hypothetical protein GCM10027321_42830 [Massilia terrae]
MPCCARSVIPSSPSSGNSARNQAESEAENEAESEAENEAENETENEAENETENEAENETENEGPAPVRSLSDAPDAVPTRPFPIPNTPGPGTVYPPSPLHPCVLFLLPHRVSLGRIRSPPKPRD